MTDREKFEAWVSDGGRYPKCIETRAGEYILASTSDRWQVWQAALASQQPADDGWIEWAGGDTKPLRDEFIVDVKWSDGSIDEGKAAGEWRWNDRMDFPNIIAYRVVNP